MEKGGAIYVRVVLCSVLFFVSVIFHFHSHSFIAYQWFRFLFSATRQRSATSAPAHSVSQLTQSSARQEPRQRSAHRSKQQPPPAFSRVMSCMGSRLMSCMSSRVFRSRYSLKFYFKSLRASLSYIRGELPIRNYDVSSKLLQNLLASLLACQLALITVDMQHLF